MTMSTNLDLYETFVAGQVANRLRTCGHPALQYVDVSAESRTIVLTRTVPTFYLKQVAQTVAKTVEGVSRVINTTVVKQPQRQAAFDGQ